MSRLSSLEIDEPEDLLLARALIPSLLDQTKVLPQSPSALIFDFDGVFTNNLVMVDENGRESVLCNRSDGLGLEDLRRATDFPLLVISKERNPVVEARCKKLNIPCVKGIDDKASILEKWAKEKNIDLDQAIFIGNDRNDLPCFELVGFAVAPADAEPEAKAAATHILERNGGCGAVREICDHLRTNSLSEIQYNYNKSTNS